MDGIFQKYNFLVNQGKIISPQSMSEVVQQQVTDGHSTWIISKNTWRLHLACSAGLPGQYKHMITSILKNLLIKNFPLILCLYCWFKLLSRDRFCCLDNISF